MAGGKHEGFSARGLCQVDTKPISTGGCLFGLWRVLWLQLCLLTALLSLTRVAHCATWIPCTFFFSFNISTFLSTFFSTSADDKDRTQWWIWFTGDCRAAHAFKALLQPTQAHSHHAYSWSGCLPGWWLPSLSASPCCNAIIIPQLQPYSAWPFPCGIQQMPP